MCANMLFAQDEIQDVQKAKSWHEIYELEKKENGKYYTAIEGWKGAVVSGSEDVFRKG